MKQENQPIIPLWDGIAPGSEDWLQPEQEDELPYRDQTLKVIRNVRQPTLTVYLPEVSRATGTAVIVCPGGAWHFLSIDLEGTEIARWLNVHGVAAFVLKYRLIQTGFDFPEVVTKNLGDPTRMAELLKPLQPLLLADAQQAVKIVRSRAAEWGLHPQHIGMMGFSAGGMVTANVSLQHDLENRPDFAAVIYGAPCEALSAPKDAPPLFLACAADDNMAVGVSLDLFSRWNAGNHPVEMHIYTKGGHGFGLRRQGLTCDSWIERFHEWLAMLEHEGMLK